MTTTDNNNDKKTSTTKIVMAWIAVGLATATLCILLFSVVGAAVFFLPMLGGALAKN